MSTNAKRTELNVVLGSTEDGAVVIVEEVFKYDDGFRGAKGVILMPVTSDDIESALAEKVDHLEEIWKMEVADDATTRGLEDWAEGVSDEDYLNNRFERYSGMSESAIAGALGSEEPERYSLEGLGRIFPSVLEGLTLIDSDEVRAAVEIIREYEKEV